MSSGLDLRLSLMPLSENFGNICSVIFYFVIYHLSVESNWVFISVYRFTFLIIIFFLLLEALFGSTSSLPDHFIIFCSLFIFSVSSLSFHEHKHVL